MSNNTIIGIVVAVVVLAIVLVFVLPGMMEEDPVLENGEDVIDYDDDPVLPEDDDIVVPDDDDIVVPDEDMAIMQLSEEEVQRVQEAYDEAIPEEMMMDPEAHMETLMALDEMLMQLSADELREITVEDIEEMLQEVQ